MKATGSGPGLLPRRAWTMVAVLAGLLGLALSTVMGQVGGGGTDVRTIPDSALMPVPSAQPTESPVAPPEPEHLLPEYARLVDREGTVLRKTIGTDPALRTVFRSADEKYELVLLENRFLEALENETDYGKKAVRLRISGTVTVYRNVNYLLLTRVQIKQP